MDRMTIDRRDFLNGVAMSVAASGAPSFALAGTSPADASRAALGDVYPPSLTGLRGNHPGSYDAAHSLAWNDEAPVTFSDTGEDYDLVIVGGGVSGLAAATFFKQQRGTDQRILILDNHDDFGGHAKRNEFTSQGRMLLGVGGSVNLESPDNYSKVALGLLEEVGVDLKKLEDALEPGYPLSTMGHDTGWFLNTGEGDARIVVGRWIAAFQGEDGYDALINQLPIPQEEKDKIIKLAGGKWDYLVGLSVWEREAYLSSTSYHQFLLDKVGLDPTTLPLFDALTRVFFGVGGDGISVSEAIMIGSPGLSAVGWPWAMAKRFLFDPDNLVHTLYFPDGNSSVARLLVRKLIPDIAAGSTMEDIASARFDYSKLDMPGAPVRLRLNSTVVRAREEGGDVTVSYVQNGKPFRVKAKHCILACYNGIIPHLCPELPAPQKEALKYGVKVPLILTNAVLRDGAPFYKAGARQFECPNSYYTVVTTAPPVKMGNYQPPQGPGDPLVVFMLRSPVPVKQEGQTARDVYRLARYELLETPFSTHEAEIRAQLTDMFGAFGFDADRDIEAITVNRWSHGYAYEYLDLDDGPFTEGTYPHQIGSAAFGRISIANSDSEGKAYLDAAIDAAWRATKEQVSLAG
jgi:spermidine dehydrogenase